MNREALLPSTGGYLSLPPACFKAQGQHIVCSQSQATSCSRRKLFLVQLHGCSCLEGGCLPSQPPTCLHETCRRRVGSERPQVLQLRLYRLFMVEFEACLHEACRKEEQKRACTCTLELEGDTVASQAGQYMAPHATLAPILSYKSAVRDLSAG